MWKILALAAVVSTGIATARAHAADPPPSPPMHDILKCDQLAWLDNCKQINQRISDNPGAPIRIVDPSGLEFNFAPGTPSVVIQHVLKPTKQSARAYLAWQDAVFQRNVDAARITAEVMLESGRIDQKTFQLMVDSPNVEPMEPSAQPAAIDYGRLKVWWLYDSQCAACLKSIPELVQLAARHPRLDLTLLQIDDNPTFLTSVRAYGLRAGPIPTAQRRDLLSRIKQTPTLWVQDERTSKTTLLEGYLPVSSLESRLADLSN